MQRILVPLDGSKLAESALVHAAAVARTFSADTILLTVADALTDDADPFADPFQWHLRRQEAAAYLEAAAGTLRAREISVVTSVSDGAPADAIHRAVAEHDAELVIMTSHGRGGPTDFALSGTIQKVVIAGKTSVLVVRTRSLANAFPERYECVLAPVDGSPRSEWALHLAARIAQAHRAELVICHVVRVPVTARPIPVTDTEQALMADLVRTSRGAVEEYIAGLKRQLESDSLDVKVRIEESFSIAPTIDRIALDLKADLVVLCAHGSGCLDDPAWRYGSVSASLLAYGSTPLMVCQDLPAKPSSSRRRSRQRRPGHPAGATNPLPV